MNADIAFFLSVLLGLLAVMDPIGAIPIFLGITPSDTKEQRRRTVGIAVITAFAALCLFTLGGKAILSFFGISLAAFRVSGGILLLLMALAMMGGEQRSQKSTPSERAEAKVSESVAIFPLAIPLLAGPGALSSVILFSERAATLAQSLAIYLAITAAAVLAWLALRSSELVRKALGVTGIRVVTRIMGLILAALAVQFIADGMLNLFPGLG